MEKRRSVKDIKNEYHLTAAVHNLNRESYNKAYDKWKKKQDKFYGIYYILFILSVVFVGVFTHSVENVAFYLFMGSFVSVFLTSHLFVEIFTLGSQPSRSDYDCENYERDRYMRDVKNELVESLLNGSIVRTNWDKSGYQTWNVFVKLDEDKMAHEYYVNFFVDDEKNTIDIDASEVFVNN